MTDYKTTFRNNAKAKANGCPLMDGRNKGNADDYVDERLTIEDAFKMNGDGGAYYVVTFKELDALFFMSGGKLTEILDEAYETAQTNGVSIADVAGGLEIAFGAKVKTKNGRDFRPVHVY